MFHVKQIKEFRFMKINEKYSIESSELNVTVYEHFTVKDKEVKKPVGYLSSINIDITYGNSLNN